jgi:hypothetical protein
VGCREGVLPHLAFVVLLDVPRSSSLEKDKHDNRCLHHNKPVHREQVLQEFKAVVPKVLTEKGCIEYSATTHSANYGAPQSPLGDDTFAIIEKMGMQEGFDGACCLGAHETVCLQSEAPHRRPHGASAFAHLRSLAAHLVSLQGLL